MTKEYNTVSDLNNAIKKTIEDPYSNIKVSGEISNVKISNKNLFATLKDADSSISVVSWGYGYKKNQTNLSNGDTITITGKLVVYLKSGNVCIVGCKFEKLGVGDLHLEYEQLKKKCDDSGYFNNKKLFPNCVSRIGIATALEGAALQDILYVLKKNAFVGQIVVKGCAVQGTNAPQSIIDAITSLLEWKSIHGRLDVIVVTRGGGSFEDLIAFSDENVLKKIKSSDIFTISAVGHEVDFMLSDFVADLRAPTPSVSGEILTNHQRNQSDDYQKFKNIIFEQFKVKILGKIQQCKSKIKYLSSYLQNQNPEDKINKSVNELDLMTKGMKNILKLKIDKMKSSLEFLSNQASRYDIKNMLTKGYVVLTKNNRIIDSVSDLKHGQKLKLKLRDGDVDVIVDIKND